MFLVEYAMSALQNVCERLNDNLSKDFDQTKSVLEEAKTNQCSSHTKNQLKSKGFYSYRRLSFPYEPIVGLIF